MYSETMCSDLGLFWEYTTYMFNLCSWTQNAHVNTWSNVYRHVTKYIRSWTNLFEKEWSKSVRILQTFLQLPKKEAEQDKRQVRREVSYCTSEAKQRKLCSLLMCVSRTLCASRRSGGCCQTRFYLFPSYHRGRPPPSSGSCSPNDADTNTSTPFTPGSLWSSANEFEWLLKNHHKKKRLIKKQLTSTTRPRSLT